MYISHRKKQLSIYMLKFPQYSHANFNITALRDNYQLLRPIRTMHGVNMRVPAKNGCCFSVGENTLRLTQLRLSLMSAAASTTLPSLSWMLSCVVINFPDQFMPNISEYEQWELIAFLTMHFSPWNVISLPQLTSPVRAGSAEPRP